MRAQRHGPMRSDGVIEFGTDTLGRAVGDHTTALSAGAARSPQHGVAAGVGQSGLSEGSPTAVTVELTTSAGARPGSPAGGTAGTQCRTTAGSPDPYVC